MSTYKIGDKVRLNENAFHWELSLGDSSPEFRRYADQVLTVGDVQKQDYVWRQEHNPDGATYNLLDEGGNHVYATAGSHWWHFSVLQLDPGGTKTKVQVPSDKGLEWGDAWL